MAQCSPPQTPPGGSVPVVNTSSAPSHPTSSDDALDKCGDSGKRKRFRNKNEKNVALNKLSQLRYRHAGNSPTAEHANPLSGRAEITCAVHAFLRPPAPQASQREDSSHGWRARGSCCSFGSQSSVTS